MLKNNRRSQLKRKSLNPMWKGDKVTIGQLHQWIKRNFKNPKLCQRCRKSPVYDLANKGIYNRDIKNWEWLCRKCHMLSDGRLKKFLSHRKPFKKGNKLNLLVRNRLLREDHPLSKLTDKEVLEIRKKYALINYTLDKLGKEYNVNPVTIWLIVNRKTWKSI